jgi:hypothetical protein
MSSCVKGTKGRHNERQSGRLPTAAHAEHLCGPAHVEDVHIDDGATSFSAWCASCAPRLAAFAMRIDEANAELIAQPTQLPL